MAWRIHEHVSRRRRPYWTVEDRSRKNSRTWLQSLGGAKGGQSLYFKREDAERALADILAALKTPTHHMGDQQC